MSRKRGGSLCAGILSTFAGMLFLAAAAFTITDLVSMEMTLTRDLHDEGRMLARLAASSAKTPLVFGEKKALEDAVQRFISDTHVLSLTILDAERQVLFTRSGAEREDGARSTALFTHPITVGGDRRQGAPLSFGKKKDAARDITVGYARVLTDTSRRDREIENALFRGAVIGLVFLLAGGGLMYRRIREITGSLVTLDDALKQVGEGMELEKVVIESPQEVGRLSESFNAMIESLERRAREHQHLEEKLRHAQKMEAVGTLVRGISHDFNNILATIRGAVHILLKKLGKDPILQRYAEKIEKSITEANKLIEGLITFSRRKMLHYRIVDINRLVGVMKPLIVNVTEEHDIRLSLNLSKELLLIRGDSFCIEQVVWNLCLNAKDAMQGGGHLTIRTDTVIARGGAETAEEIDRPRQYALLSVTDTGTGIDAETRERIFEPFYTTKETGKGTGLGLSIVHAIIEQHKGSVEVGSREGEGTTFSILLPLND